MDMKDEKIYSDTMIDEGTQFEQFKEVPLQDAPSTIPLTHSSSSRKLDRTFYFGFILFFILGYAPWLLVNGVFLQLPAFILKLPEGNQISFYLAVAIQCGNVFSLMYMIASHYAKLNEKYFIFIILCIAVVVSLLIGLLWTMTCTMGGETHSGALLTLTVLAGAIGSLSNLTFWSYMSNFKPIFIGAMSTGMGFSGIFPSIIAAVQEPGTSPRFSVLVFFILLALLLLFSLLIFIAIEFTSFISKYRKQEETKVGENDDSDDSKQVETHKEAPTEISPSKSRSYIFQNLCLIFIISNLNFFVLGVIYYFVLKADYRILLWMMIFGMVGQPSGRFVTVFFKTSYPRILTAIQALLFIFYFIFGSPMSVFGWGLIPLHFLFSFIFGFNCTMIFKGAASLDEIYAAKTLCRWLGFAEQSGACISAILSFVLGKYVLFAH